MSRINSPFTRVAAQVAESFQDEAASSAKYTKPMLGPNSFYNGMAASSGSAELPTASSGSDELPAETSRYGRTCRPIARFVSTSTAARACATHTEVHAVFAMTQDPNTPASRWSSSTGTLDKLPPVQQRGASSRRGYYGQKGSARGQAVLSNTEALMAPAEASAEAPSHSVKHELGNRGEPELSVGRSFRGKDSVLLRMVVSCYARSRGRAASSLSRALALSHSQCCCGTTPSQVTLTPLYERHHLRIPVDDETQQACHGKGECASQQSWPGRLACAELFAKDENDEFTVRIGKAEAVLIGIESPSAVAPWSFLTRCWQYSGELATVVSATLLEERRGSGYRSVDPVFEGCFKRAAAAVIGREGGVASPFSLKATAVSSEQPSVPFPPPSPPSTLSTDAPPSLLFVESVEVLPSYRGAHLGRQLVTSLLNNLEPYYTLCMLCPCPLSTTLPRGDHTLQSTVVLAAAKLYRHWQSAGFRGISSPHGTEYMGYVPAWRDRCGPSPAAVPYVCPAHLMKQIHENEGMTGLRRIEE